MEGPRRWAAYLGLGLSLGLTALASQARAEGLRVCADPNNLPFSNAHGEGFENRIASLLAGALGEKLEYLWAPQRRGFLRRTLQAGLCDVVIGVPAELERVTRTPPVYRSRYVFVQPASAEPLRSLDDPRLKTMRIGVQLIGDDGMNTPSAHALSARGIVTNVKGSTVQSDYGDSGPAAALVESVAKGELDAALVWGPVAGYFAAKNSPQLQVTPVETDHDGPMAFSYAMAVGMRRGSATRKANIERALSQIQPDVERVLEEFHVPR